MSAAALFLALVPCLASASPAQSGARFDAGVDAYRRQAYAEARESWLALLEQRLLPEERARVYFDLGNASWRLERPFEAIACYSAALRLDPHLDVARENLEFARAKSGLPPADAGDLNATLERLLTGLAEGERRLLVTGALVLWLLLLGLEVRFGGALLRGLLVAGTVVLVLAAVPWASQLVRPEPRAPMLVVENGNVSLRAEPLEARPAIAELTALEQVERLDELPGWVRVERADGQRGWVRAGALFALNLGNG